MASNPLLTEAEMEKWFEEGRIPCSFSQQQTWASVLTKLDRFERQRDQKISAIIEEQRKKKIAVDEILVTQTLIQELSEKVTQFQKAVRHHEDTERSLQEEVDEWQELNILSLKAFAESASKMEEKLVSQLEVQLARDREGLFPLQQKKSPKLGLLLNCFGAGSGTIQALSELDGIIHEWFKLF